MAEAPRTGIGNVDFELLAADGVTLEKKTLIPSLTCCQTLSRMSGGLTGVATRVSELNLDVIVTVVCLGLGYSGGKRPPRDIEDRIYQTGLITLSQACARFINIIANGGRPIDLGEILEKSDDTQGEKGSNSEEEKSQENPPQS